MLHIVTPLFRYEYLNSIYESIAPYPDVTWHIAKIQSRPPLTNAFLADPRVRIYELNCPDNDTISKRNHIFDRIQDGYFYMLDDDTRLHPNLYRLYKQSEEQEFVGMILGTSLRLVLGTTLESNYPEQMTTPLDTGMGIAHHSVLRHVRWGSPYDVPNDCYFWYCCYQYFGREATVLTSEVVSYHNYFGPYIRVRKSLFGKPLSFDIYNKPLAFIYHQAHRTHRGLRKVLKRPINPPTLQADPRFRKH